MAHCSSIKVNIQKFTKSRITSIQLLGILQVDNFLFALNNRSILTLKSLSKSVTSIFKQSLVGEIKTSSAFCPKTFYLTLQLKIITLKSNFVMILQIFFHESRIVNNFQFSLIVLHF